MKPTILLAALFIITTTVSQAQDGRSPFRKGYTRLGIQTIGKALDQSLTPGNNILKGNIGTSTGFIFEKGRIFYFIPPSEAKFINAGVDWTILSLTYNSSKVGWKKYVDKNTSYSEDDFTAKLNASISTKIGGVISINPAQDLVIDLRIQASIGAYAVGPIYESSGSEDNAFYPYKENGDASGIKKITQYLSTTGVKPNIGTTVRWRGIGLAADYSPGKVKMIYTERNGGAETSKSTKVPLNSLQVKLSLSF